MGEVEPDALWHREGTLVTIPLQKKFPERWTYVVAGPRVKGDKSTIDCTSLNLLGRHHAGMKITFIIWIFVGGLQRDKNAF